MRKLQPGDPAPSFALRDQDDKLVELPGSIDKRLLIYFVSEAESPTTTRLACALRDVKDLLEGHDVQIVGISPERPDSHKRFGAKYELEYPLLSDNDSTVAKTFGAFGERTSYGRKTLELLPSFFLLDKTGRVESSWIDVNHETSVAVLMNHLDAQTPDQQGDATTREPVVPVDEAFAASLTAQSQKLAAVYEKVSVLNRRADRLDNLEQEVIGLGGRLSKALTEMREHLAQEHTLSEKAHNQLQLMNVTVDNLANRMDSQEQIIGNNEDRAEKFRTALGSQLSLLGVQISELSNEFNDFTRRVKEIQERLEENSTLTHRIATLQARPLLGVEERLGELEERVLGEVQKVELGLRKDVKVLAKIITQNIVNQPDPVTTTE